MTTNDIPVGYRPKDLKELNLEQLADMASRLVEIAQGRTPMSGSWHDTGEVWTAWRSVEDEVIRRLAEVASS